MPGNSKSDLRFSIATPATLGKDKLLFRQMDGVERVSQPFEFSLAVLCESGTLDADKILGQGMTVTCIDRDGSKRYFHGLVAEFAQTGFVNRLHEYQLVLRPWIWFLTLAADCRIFQGKSAVEIFEKIAKEQHHFSDYKLELKHGPYKPLDYSVQYRETDFNFVCRLLEHEGIHYYFRHQDGKHIMVLTDEVDQGNNLAGHAEIRYHPPGATLDVGEKHGYLRDWSVSRQVLTGTYATTDFNFEKPKVSLLRNSTISRSHPHAEFEIFDYPAEPAVLDEATTGKLAKVRIEELQLLQMQARGHGDTLGLAPGHCFKLVNCPRQDFNTHYMVLSARYAFTGEQYFSGQDTGGPAISVTVEALDARAPFRPARMTPKPVVHGAQTAMVVGPGGEEIHTDKHGRVKVQFHWDRAATGDEQSSCWIRVAQVWAGKGWGTIHIPRIGQEVLVDFLEGDPDRPIITGRVYNGESAPPYKLPDNATQSGIKTRSSPGGGDATANELRFEDKKGSEEIHLHAEKDLKIEVEHDGTLTVDHDQITTIKNDLTTKIDGEEKRDIGKKYKLTAADEITIETGQSKIVMKKNGEIKISGDKITISGTSKVEVSALEVKVSGDTKVDLSSSGQMQIKGMKTAVQGTMLELNGDAMAKLKGGMTMIG
jgi:type VI secretion system secreted protein VgrG